jgi:hypothetical protein
MPRFAILLHDSPRGLHYDLLLEAGEVLRTWALPQIPAPGEVLECEALSDHRMIYLDYEGPISGDRGSVTRWDRGTFEVESWTDDRVVLQLSGERIVGQIELQQLPDDTARWRIARKAEQL